MAERFLNPETQFLDSSGKPRVNGKLAFHENDTLIDKDTFKDVNLTPALINDNPLLLTADGRIPNCFYAGTARVIGTDDSGQFMDKDNVGISGTGAAFDTFNSVTEYEKGAIVVASDEEIYRSLQNNNQGNDPTSSPTFWEQVQFVGTFNVNITYADDDLVQASNGQLYRSIQAANLNNEPSASPTFWRNASADQDLDTTDNVDFNEVDVQSTDDATSTTSAPLKSAGGLAVAKKIIAGDTIESQKSKGAITRNRATEVGSSFTPGEAVGIFENFSDDTSGAGASIAGQFRTNYEDVSGTAYSNVISARDSVGLNDIAQFFGADLISEFFGPVRKTGTHPMVQAFLGATVSNVTGDGTAFTIIYGSEISDQGGDYNVSTGVFTAPVTGKYLVTLATFLSGLTSSHTRWVVDIVTSNRGWFIFNKNPFAIDASGVEETISAIVDMDANDTLTISTKVFNGTKVVDLLSFGATDQGTSLQITLVA